MTSSTEIIEEAHNLLTKLEKHISDETIKPEHLLSVQAKLDNLDQELKLRGYRDSEIHVLYEIQALIYGQQNKDDKANSWLNEAIRQAGNPDKLSSNLLKNYFKSTTPLYIPFVRRSLLTVSLLSFFTLGIYLLVWNDKNWRAIQLAKPQKMWPFWRAIFSWFWVWPLFKEMTEYAKSHGYKGKITSPGKLAWLYALPLLISQGVSRIPDDKFNGYLWLLMVILLSITIFSVVRIQKMINALEDISIEDRQRENRWTILQIIIIGIGICIFCLATYGWFSTTPMTTESSAATAKRQEAEKLLNDYTICTDELSTLKATLDNTSQSSVDAYNAKLDTCNTISSTQNDAVNEYKRLTNTAQ